MAEPPAFPPPPGHPEPGAPGPITPPAAGGALPPPGAVPPPAAGPWGPGPGPAAPSAGTPVEAAPAGHPASSKGSRTGVIAVLAIAAVVVLGVVAVLVFGGGDDEGERVASDDTEAVDETDAVDETRPTDTEPEASDAPASTTPATEPTDTPTTEPPATEPPTTEAPEGGLVSGAPPGLTGTRTEPVAVGQIADIGDGWRLQVLDVVPDATAAVMESDFNDPPPPGSRFTTVLVAMGYYGLDDPESFFMPTVSAIGAAAVELDSDCGLVPRSLEIFADAFAGGVLVGNLCFVTTPADEPVLQLYASADFFTDAEVFLAATPPGAAVTPMPTIAGPQAGAAATPQRTAPTPIGTPGDLGSGWSLTVTAPARDVTDEAMAENTFNDPPPEGFRMVAVEVTLAYSGEGTGSAFDVTTKWVDAGNVQRTGYCGVIPNEIDVFADVFAGGAVSGSLCFLVPTAETGTGTLYATSGFDEDYVYFATR